MCNIYNICFTGLFDPLNLKNLVLYYQTHINPKLKRKNLAGIKFHKIDPLWSRIAETGILLR
jgi:hypothetical protein